MNTICLVLVSLASIAFLLVIILSLSGHIRMECDKIPGKFDSCRLVYKGKK